MLQWGKLFLNMSQSVQHLGWTLPVRFIMLFNLARELLSATWQGA